MIERLGPERLRTYPLLVLAAAAVAWLGWMLVGDGRLDPAGRAVGADFVAFHAAGDLVLQGSAAEVYRWEALHAAIDRIVVLENPNLPIHYPPPALLIFALPALFQYELGLAVWTALSVGLMVAGIRAVGDGPLAWRWGLAYPGVLLTVFNGQTSGLVLGLLALSLGLLASSPVLAGLALGTLVFKPNYLALALVALLAGRRWRALAGAVGTALGWCALSAVVLGPDAWTAWWNHSAMLSEIIASGALPLEKMPTLFASLASFGVSGSVASAVQLAVAGVVVLTVAAVWRRGADASIEHGVLAAGTLLVSPFAFDYDLATVWIAIHALALHRERIDGALPLASIAWLLPLLVPLLAALYVPLSPVVLLAVVGLLAREGFRDGNSPQSSR